MPAHAVILAAGLGSRLGYRTAAVPKCLVQVAGQSILLNALCHLSDLGVQHATVVAGYLADCVEAVVRSARVPMDVVVRRNARFATTGTSCSLWTGLPGVEEDVLVIEGDVYFDRSLLQAFLTAASSDATVVDSWNQNIDGSTVEVDDQRYVTRWLHQASRPPEYDPAGTWKTVNIHRFSTLFVRTHLRPALAAEMARGGVAPLEFALAAVVANGGRIEAARAVGQWVEVDDERDLRRAERMFGVRP